MISIAVLVSDEDYAAGLEKYLTADPRGEFSFGVYNERGGFERFVAEHEPVVTVVEEGLELPDNCIRSISLVKGKTDGEADGISMYRSLETVAGDITREAEALMGHFSRQEERGVSRPGALNSEQAGTDRIEEHMGRFTGEPTRRASAPGIGQITCVCSPFGGTYTSTFAFALAYYHSKGTRTLFVSFDPFFWVSSGFEQTSAGGLGKLIYLLDGGSDRAIERCAGRVGGLDCISGADHWTDICDMKKEHAEKLIDLIEKQGYKNVVFDIKLFGSASVPLLNSAGRILVPSPAGRNERSVEEWIGQLGRVGIDRERVSRIAVPFDALIEKGFDQGTLLKGRLGRFIEETEGRRYVR